MGSVYKREDSPFLWIGFTDAGGNRKLKSAKTTDIEAAKKILEAVEKRIAAEKERGFVSPGGLTVATYAAQWLAERERRNVASVKDDTNWLRHATPAIGRMPLAEVKPRHLRDLMRDLQAKGELAPRSILHVYGVLRVMFGDAVVEELISATPAVLKQRRGELPKKRDKDPRWRETAIYERHEVEALISDERIPERQRVLYGLEFLCGVRVNEVTPRRWGDYDAVAEPLGRLNYSTAWALKRKVEKETKTGNARQVPVHPTLAKLLAKWKLSGWAEMYGRPPGPEDLIIPARPHHQRHRTPDMASRIQLNSTVELEGLHKCLELLGLRKRRQHDFRRTLITLGQADGARREVLETITHDPKGDITSLYTSFPWPTKCEAIAKLNVHLREGRVLPLAPTGGATSMLREPETPELTTEKLAQGGIRSLPPTPSEALSSNVSAREATASVAGSALSAPQGTSERSERSSGDYEDRARALGFTLLFTSEAG